MRRRTSRSGLEIILVNEWEGVGARTEAQDFCQIWGVAGPVLVDEAGDYARLLGIRGVPTNVFVDSDGTVTAVGAVTPAELETETRRLLGTSWGQVTGQG
ncbi:MAG: TlpA family protein disulfide reductase [Acidimicrobiales bacterium]